MSGWIFFWYSFISVAFQVPKTSWAITYFLLRLSYTTNYQKLLWISSLCIESSQKTLEIIGSQDNKKIQCKSWTKKMNILFKKCSPPYFLSLLSNSIRKNEILSSKINSSTTFNDLKRQDWTTKHVVSKISNRLLKL